MRDRDRAEAALLRNPLHEVVVEVRDAVPEDVAGCAPHEQRTLTDRERRRAADAEDAVVVSHLRVVPVDELLPREPHLALAVRDVLPRVLADRTRPRRLARRRV